MKRLGVMIATIVCFGVFASAQSQAFEMSQRYQIKSGIVEYEVSGSQSGTETLYFKNHGQQEARHSDTTMSFMGIKQKTNSIQLMDGDWSYNVDLNTNTAMKMSVKDTMKMMQGDKKISSFKNFSDQMIEAMGGQKVGQEKVLGKKCDIVEFSDFGSKVWVYKGVPLKTEVSMMGMNFSQVATSFKENAKIPQDKIELPKNVKIQDAPNIQELMNARAVRQGVSGESPDEEEVANYRKDMQAGMEQFNSDEFQQNMAEARKAMEEASPQMEEAMKALQGLFGGQ